MRTLILSRTLRSCTAAMLLSGFAVPTFAKVDLVTLPRRNAVQLTIYNSADLTLVRDTRDLTLVEGENTLQFSWANTLIDPTSLDLRPRRQADQIDILDLVFPARVNNVGIWNIMSRAVGKVTMDIDYFTSGLSWRAFYMGTLTPDEATMQLQGYVVVRNDSGEDYENAQTRLIVGKVHLLDQIAQLSRRQYPYGRPGMRPVQTPMASPMAMRSLKNAVMMDMAYGGAAESEMGLFEEAKEIKKEGLSEYFLYTIPGTETIPNGWAKRLPSFDVADIPVKNLYKYNESRYGTNVIRFLSFKNDTEHELGETPIPGGTLAAYRALEKGADARLSYEGASSFQYIPVNEDVELNLGPAPQVLVDITRMNTATKDYLFDQNGDIAGWIELETFRVRINNTRPVPAKIEITRNAPAPLWTIENSGDCGRYQKIDAHTYRYTLELPPATPHEFTLLLTSRYGRRAE
ncbi:MAG: DUF4139 domain-containing protein [Kiritimatiellae bacterium]|nr:DUF4139 domain-containing protein [Kiritimatiellia bacterium]